MIVYITQGRLPMDDHFYVADDAVITGDVTIGKNVTIWFQTIIRGDVAPIRIGQGTNIQDSSMVHCEYQCEQVIEENIVIGHKAILHGKQVGAGTLIGMGAILLSGSIIGEECIIAAGAVVRQNEKIPRRSMLAGVPAKIFREVTEEDLKISRAISLRYIELGQKYAQGQFQWNDRNHRMTAYPVKGI